MRLIDRIRRHRMRRKGHIGPNSHIDPTAQVLGWDNIVIGDNCSIGEHCCLNVNFRDGPRLRIGDNCFIGRRNFFSTGDFIEIGDYCLSGPNCFFLGAGHVTDSPFTPYIVSGIENYGRLTVGANCWLTSNVTLLGGITIGHGVIIGAGSVVKRSIPPFCMVAGNPARVVKLFDRDRGAWIGLDERDGDPDAVLREHAEAAMPEGEYVALLKAKYGAVHVPKIAAGIAAGEI